MVRTEGVTCCQVNCCTRSGLLKVILKRIAGLSPESALGPKPSKHIGYKAIGLLLSHI